MRLTHRLVSEFLATAMLLAVVIGSGIMGERLAADNMAVALLANTLATVGGLFVLIEVFVQQVERDSHQQFPIASGSQGGHTERDTIHHRTPGKAHRTKSTAFVKRPQNLAAAAPFRRIYIQGSSSQRPRDASGSPRPWAPNGARSATRPPPTQGMQRRRLG